MQTILNEKKSDIGSPYVYYTVKVEPRNRQTNQVDMYTEFNAHLEYSSSSLYSGELECFIYFYELDSNGNKIGNTEQVKSLYIKSDNDRWSGTSNHKVSYTFTLNASAPSTKLGARFKVERYGGSAGQLNRIDVDDIDIPIGHEVPSNITHTMVETNPLLTATGVSNDVIVENLSQKQFTLTYTLHDSATVTKYGLLNRLNGFLYDTNPFTLDLTNTTLDKDITDNTKIPIRVLVRDSFNTQGVGDIYLYSYIPYTPISLTNSVTTAKRNGQTSGKVKLNVKGLMFNGVIGNVDQSSYKPTIKYKYWLANDTEPSTYANTIPSSLITITNNEFEVNGYEIGSTTETAPNYFNPDNAYRVKIYVEDNFTNATSNEIQIAKGIAIWSEYIDKVDFVAITRNKKQIYPQYEDTNEHIVGTDDNGNDIYAKTITTSTSSGNNDITLPNNITFRDATGSTTQTSGNVTPLAYYHSSTDWCNWFYRQSTNTLVVRCGSTAGYGSARITIEYIKSI